MGGLIVEGRHYFSMVERPWRTVKARYFDGVDVPLHASDLRKPTTAQIGALNDFFSAHSFGRFAVTCTDETRVEIGTPVEVLVAGRLWEHIAKVANTMNFYDILVLIEENRRLEPAIQRGFMSSTPQNAHRVPIPVTYMTHLKNPAFAGMEVADFIVHTAGRQARRLRGHHFDCTFNKIEPDFKQVFSTARMRSSCMNLSRVSQASSSSSLD